MEAGVETSSGMIAVVEGAPGDAIQKLFGDAIAGRGLSVSGVIAENHHLPDRMCTAGYLRSIGSAERFKIFEDQGPGAAVCHLDGAGALLACAAVQRDIAAGCNLVVLSKFGKLEAAGEGLLGAFRAAIDARIPLLTSVSPKAATAWQALTGGQFTTLPAEAGPVGEWIRLAVH